MKERIRMLRKELGLTREEFAQQLGFKSRGKIDNLELGRTEPDEAFLKLICNTFHVNYQWLINGNGDMFAPLERSQIITDFVGDLIKEEDSFKTRLIEALAKLDDTEWEVLEKLAESLSHKKG